MTSISLMFAIVGRGSDQTRQVHAMFGFGSQLYAFLNMALLSF